MDFCNANSFYWAFSGSHQIHGLLISGALLDKRSPPPPQRASSSPKEDLQPQCAAAD